MFFSTSRINISGNQMLKNFVFPVLMLVLLSLEGCAYSAYGVYDDQRLLDTISDDKAMATSIKTALLNEHFLGGMAISIYCFYGNVFLVGEIPQKLEGKALAIARSFKPRSVTPHWFSPAKSDRNNLVLATDLRTALIGAKDLSSTRIDTEVNAGRVVLLGVVKDNAEKQQAIRIARKVPGVVSVTSYLMLPQKPSQMEKPQPIEESSGYSDSQAENPGQENMQENGEK